MALFFVTVVVRASVVEIKCPYNARECSPHDAVDSIDCLHIFNGELHLNTSHAYYYQVQAQMIICQANFADFVVWTMKGIFIERIKPDNAFSVTLSTRLVLSIFM